MNKDLEKGIEKHSFDKPLSVGFDPKHDNDHNDNDNFNAADDKDKKDGEKDKGITSYLTDLNKWSQESLKTIKTRGENTGWFIGTFLTGMCSVCISLTLLPFIVIMPGKVAFFFNLGAICILCSLALVKGWKAFCIDELLWNKEDRKKSLIGIGFMLTMFLCLFVGWRQGSWTWTILWLFAEIILLAALLNFYFPGSYDGIMKFFKFIFEKIKECWVHCFTKK